MTTQSPQLQINTTNMDKQETHLKESHLSFGDTHMQSKIVDNGTAQPLGKEVEAGKEKAEAALQTSDTIYMEKRETSLGD